MKVRHISLLIFMSVLSLSFSVEKILYLPTPVPGKTTTNYPQEEATGYFIHDILKNNLAALSEWAITTEKPTNTNTLLLYRLETIYTLSGPLSRPMCLYTYRLYNDKNELILETNTSADIRYGIFDAVDVAVFSTGKALGEDLSRYGFLTLTIPPMGDTPFQLFLNKTKILDLTNTSPFSQQYRLSSAKLTTLSVKEKPSLQNLWLGKTLWETNLTLSQGESREFPILLLSTVSFSPVKTELFLPAEKSYTLTLRPTNSPTISTNITLSTKKETQIALPLGSTFFCELTYTPKNLTVSTDTLILKKISLVYQPTDKKQTRPLYLSIGLSGHVSAPEYWQYQAFPFIRASLSLFYYFSMSQRIGITLAPEVMGFPANFPFVPQEQSLGSFLLTWGWYPFHKKYQLFRFCLEFDIGWQKGNFVMASTDPTPVTPETLKEVSEIFNAITTGPLFELSPSLEIGLFSIGASLWIAPRRHPMAGEITVTGIGLFVKTIL